MRGTIWKGNEKEERKGRKRQEGEERRGRNGIRERDTR